MTNCIHYKMQGFNLQSILMHPDHQGWVGVTSGKFYQNSRISCHWNLLLYRIYFSSYESSFLAQDHKERNAAQGSICIYHYRRGSLQLVELSILNAKNGLKYGMDKLLENEICGFGGSVAKGLVGLIFNARVVHEFWRPSAS